MKSIAYNTVNASNRVYINTPKGMVYHSAHTTYLLAQSEAVSCLRMGLTDKCIVRLKDSAYAFTMAPMTYEHRRAREVYREIL